MNFRVEHIEREVSLFMIDIHFWQDIDIENKVCLAYSSIVNGHQRVDDGARECS